jgi:hypothetical protein
MNWTPIIRQLLYSVQFENDPQAGMSRVLQVVLTSTNPISPAQYVEAIGEALASSAELGKIGNMAHPEAVVRQFLEAVRGRLSAGVTEGRIEAPGKI